jgi:NitT/TauT family transport system substrate-binding protein
MRQLNRRGALLGTFKVSTVALLTACSGAAAPTAAPTQAPAAAAPAATQAPAAAAPAPANTIAPASSGTLEKLDLAFCSQVLCILPYEVARRRGLWEAEGLDVNLVYMKGGAQAMNALLANSIDFVGTPMDLVVQAWAKAKKPVMLTSTARLPFFALVTGPKSGIDSVKGLVGKKVGVGNLGTTDHLLAQYLLKKEAADPAAVEFVALGPNILDLVVKGEVDAAMVQEPALTHILKGGGKSLVNFMNLKEATAQLGAGYQFMGLNTRPEVLETKTETAKKLIRGLKKANAWILANSGAEIVKAAPSELVAGGDVEVFAKSLDLYKADLYPSDGLVDESAVQRVVDVQALSGVLKDAPPFKASELFTNKLVPA